MRKLGFICNDLCDMPWTNRKHIFHEVVIVAKWLNKLEIKGDKEHMAVLQRYAQFQNI